MAENEIRVGDVGTVYFGNVYDSKNVIDPMPVSAATTKQFIFKKPSGEKLTVTAQFVTDGNDGALKYTFVAGDIDEAGTWKGQIYLVLPTGEWYSDIDEFEVYQNL